MGALISDASPARFVPVLGFAILSLALLLFYFIAVRPRRGTTEWFSRVGTRPFTPLRCEKLCWTDIIWCVLSADLGAALSVLAFFPLAAEVKAMLLPAGICAVCYVALRLLGLGTALCLLFGCSPSEPVSGEVSEPVGTPVEVTTVTHGDLAAQARLSGKVAAAREVSILAPLSAKVTAVYVRVGDKVTIGQKIGEPGGFVSAPIHASVSGTVKAVEPRPFSMGGTMMSVVIENDFQNTVCPDIHPVADPDSLTPEQLVEIVKNAGIVGQGGATFPTHVKISSGLGKVDYVIINAAECEPYITGDHRTMLERPEQVIKGATLLAKCFGVDKVYIGVEANKQNAADVLNKTIAELKAPVVVEVLHTRYPQGAEKQLVQAVSGRQVPSGKLPADAGCCIFNLNTTCSIYKAVYTGMPVVSKVVTVSGSGVIEPKNIECPIGTPITNLFDACGGLKEETYKLIMGGPMMGLAQYNLDVTVGKGTGAMLAFADKEEQYVAEPQCIRCGKCVGVCPIRLEPVFMYKYLTRGDVDTWQNVLHGMDCIECGACTYTCPARLPLTHMFRMGKQQVYNARMAAKAKAEAEKAAAEKKEA